MTRWGAALMAAVAVAAMWLPWWTASVSTLLLDDPRLTDLGRQSLRGTELLGSTLTWAVVLAGVVVLIGLASTSGRPLAEEDAPVRRWPEPGWWWVTAAGAGVASVGVIGLGTWGLSAGAAATAVGGLAVFAAALVVLVGAVPRRYRPVPAVLVLVAVPAWFVPVAEPEAVAVENPGPLQLIAAGPVPDGEKAPTSGASVLPRTLGYYEFVPVNDGFAISSPEGLVRLDDGHITELVRVDEGDLVTVRGVVDDRVVASYPDRLVVAEAATEPAAVTGVEATGPLSPDGKLLVATGDRQNPTVRLLDVRDVEPGARVDGTTLPVVELPSTVGSLGVTTPARLFSVGLVDSGGRVVSHGPEHENQLVVAEPGGAEWSPLVGGFDETCGLTASGPDSHVGTIDAIAHDGDGWLLVARNERQSRVLTLSKDGVLRATAPLATPATSVVRDGDGSLLVVSRTGLWRLPADAVVDLPEPAADCAAHPVVGDPARLVELRAGDTGGTVVDVRGRRVLPEGKAIVSVGPDGTRTTLARRVGDPEFGLQFVPDGRGGVWWLEVLPPDASNPLQTRRLVHAPADGPVRYGERVPGGDDIGLTANLSGGDPLVGNCRPKRYVGGGERPLPAIEKAFDQCVQAVIAPDGTGWALSEQGLFSFDPSGAGTVTPVIDPARDTADPVAVQLAHGVPPAEVALVQPRLTLDAAGRPLVRSADVLLGVRNGRVVVVAQDPRLAAAFQVAEGGTVVIARGGTPYRLDH